MVGVLLVVVTVNAVFVDNELVPVPGVSIDMKVVVSCKTGEVVGVVGFVCSDAVEVSTVSRSPTTLG